VHKSESFWKENAIVLEENDCKLLKILISLLDTGNSRTQAVACYDIGEFIRFHPRGKKIITDLKAKILLMQLMTKPNEEVQKQALLCVQKLLVNNWAYLAKAS